METLTRVAADAASGFISSAVTYRTYAAWRAGYCQAAQVDAAAVTVDPVAPFALPVGAHPRSACTPAFLDCPRAWLPEELVDHRATRAPSTVTRLRAAAVTLAFLATGLWHPDSGFTHIGRRYGIPFDDPDEAVRAAWWQSGARDRRLDDIERDIHRQIRSATCVDAAEQLMPYARARQREIAADLLAETARIARHDDPRVELRLILDVALDTLGDLPAASGARVADDLGTAAARVRARPGRADQPLTDRDRDAAVACLSVILRPIARRAAT